MPDQSRFNGQQGGVPQQCSTKLTAEDREFLRKAGIDEERMAGVYSVQRAEQLPTEFAHYGKHALPGVVFLWQPIEGSTLRQLRRHGANGRGDYQFPKGAEMVLAVPNGYRDRVKDATKPLVIVEGTKQHLAVASALDEDGSFAVVGVSGCQGWKKDGRPIACLHNIPLEGRELIIWFDADIGGNRAVYDAAKELQERLRIEFGAAQVRFVQMPGNGKDGADDLLGPHKPERRPEIARTLIREAKGNLPTKRPAAKREQRFAPQFFKETSHGDKFLPTVMWQHLQQQHPMAVTRELSADRGTKAAITVYQGGVYVNGASRQFQRSITRALGDDITLGHIEIVTEIALNELVGAGRVIPEKQSRLVINCRNGLVDVMTGQLLPHDPDLLTTFQVPVAYNPDATCPRYMAWIEERLPGQVDALEDIACQMLDLTRTPQRFLFLFGPPRSGKSTFLRIMLALAGSGNSSAVSLHQLSDDTFASANLYGKVLNVCADLSSKDVRDLSNLKMLTGEDPINANRKYGAQFSFTNQALLAFSGNEVPAVSDATGAYQERAIPFHFSSSFAGAENPEIEQQLLAELPGILNRWIAALRNHRLRGSYIGSNADTAAAFARHSNRVQQFLDDRTIPVDRPAGTPRNALWLAWKAWVDENGGAHMGRNTFYDRVRGCKCLDFTPEGGTALFPVRLLAPDPASALLQPFPPISQNPCNDSALGRFEAASAVFLHTSPPEKILDPAAASDWSFQSNPLKTAEPESKQPSTPASTGFCPPLPQPQTADEQPSKQPSTTPKQPSPATGPLQPVADLVEQALAHAKLSPSHPLALQAATDALFGVASKQQVATAIQTLLAEEKPGSLF